MNAVKKKKKKNCMYSKMHEKHFSPQKNEPSHRSVDGKIKSEGFWKVEWKKLTQRKQKSLVWEWVNVREA